MNINDYINQVDVENIYKTILDLEGPKYPLDNWDALDNAASYIVEKLESYGIETELQEFYLEDFDKPFKNVIGYIGDRTLPATLIGSHYDTVRNSPGANDNLSAVAVSLEVARILSKLENPPTVIFASFTLEEGHPTKKKRLDEALFKKGWLDNKYRSKSAKMFNFNKYINKLLLKKWKETKEPTLKSLRIVLEEQKDIFSLEEIDYVKTVEEVYEGFEILSGPKKLSSYVVGSAWFVEKVIEENILIQNFIVYDCLGWVSNQEGTQKPLPMSKDLEPFLTLHKADLDSTIGNFIGVLGDQNSKTLLDKFINNCIDPNVDIPCFGLHIPFPFDTIYNGFSDMLRSDHAPFWEAGIPGLFISDTANFRSPHYHTGGDTYTRIDYELLAKISVATLRTLLS